MKNVIRLISSMQVLTWGAALVISFGTLLVGPAYSASNGNGSLSEWRFAIPVSVLFFLAFVAVAKTTYLKNKRFIEAPIASLLSLVAASLMVPLVSRLTMLMMFDVSLGEATLPRILQISGAAFAWQLLFAYLGAATKEHRDELAQLERSIAKEEAAEQESKKTLSKLRAQTITHIHETLSAAWPLVSLSNQLSSELRKIVDEVVRPLAKKIAADDGLNFQFAEPITSRLPLKVSLRKLFLQAKKIQVFDPVITPIAVAAITYQVRAFISGPWAAEQAVVITVALYFSLMSLGSFVLLNLSAGFRDRYGLLIGLSALVASAITDGLIFSILFSKVGFTSFPALVIPDLLISLSVFLVRVIASERAEILRKLKSHALHMRWITARTNQLIGLERQRLSNLLHGHVQDQIIAAARDEDLDNLGLTNKQELIARLREVAIEAISDHNLAESLQDFLLSRKKLWGASLSINSHVTPAAADALDVDASASQALQDLIREATTNAAKHSNAKSVSIEVELEISPELKDAPFSFISLRVENDGHTNSVSLGDGQGQTMFTKTAKSWSLELSQGQNVFFAKIPINTLP